MPKVVATQAQPDSSTIQVDSNATVNHQTDILNGLGTLVATPNTEIKQTSKQDFGALLLSGNHGGFEVKGSRTVVAASPGAVIRKQIVVSGTAIISDATLVISGNNSTISVLSGGSLILKGCHISKTDNVQTATGSYITVANGGHVACIGCYFHGAQSTGWVIVTGGPANSSGAIGCLNATGRPHGASVLVTGEITV